MKIRTKRPIVVAKKTTTERSLLFIMLIIPAKPIWKIQII